MRTSDHDDAEAFVARTAGRLTPRDGVRMDRAAPEPEVRETVLQWWIPTWSIPDGVEREELVLGYPVCNLVAEGGEARLFGPTTRATTTTLVGRGWAVGALLTPAAARHLTTVPVVDLVDSDAVVDAHGPLDEIVSARATLRSLLSDASRSLDADDRDAIRIADLVQTEPVDQVADLAARANRSVRSLQRLCLRNFGLTPAALIRRRRLQDAAARVRSEPGAPLGDVAVEFGFADHAHLTREFAAVLGFTPSRYREGA